MDRQKAIEFLKQKSNEAVFIASLPYKNNEYLPWRRNIEDILESAFGATSTEYKRVADLHLNIGGTSKVIQQNYTEFVHRIQQEVNSIIQKYEIFEKEIQSLKRSLNRREREFAAQLPLYLYDELHLHPKVVEASESLFKTGNYASAILEAFKAVNNFVKEKSGLSPNELRGIKDRPLMAKVFDEKEPLIKLNELITDTDINEQEGFKLLFMGATEGIRNPKAHDLIKMKDPYKTLEYLAFASLLIKKIDFWEAN